MSKYEMFRLGAYTCQVPPICTNAWSTDDWINWIDWKGKWNNK